MFELDGYFLVTDDSSYFSPFFQGYSNSVFAICGGSTFYIKLPTSFDITSIIVMDNNGLSAEPWCRPTFTSKLFVDPISVLTDVVHPSYIACITLMYSSPTFCLS